MPWETPTLKQLYERTSADFSGRLLHGGKVLFRSVIAVLSKVWAGLCHGLHAFLAWCFKQVFPDTAEELYLLRWAAVFGMEPNAASFATGPATFPGTPGSSIPAGWGVSSKANGEEYTVLEEASADVSGVITVSLKAVEPGPDGNMPAGQEVTLSAPRPGVTSSGAVGSISVSGGFAEESLDAFRARFLERLRTPPRGGSKADFEAWAKSISGVTRAWCFPLGVGLGTVSLTFVTDGAADPIPTPEMVARVQAYIDEKKPAPVKEAEVFAPERMVLDFELSVTPDTEAVRTAVRNSLADLVAFEATAKGFTFLHSHITEAISQAEGETDHTLISPAGNVDVPAGYFPVMGEVVFTPAGTEGG